ncbi:MULTISPECIES: class I SAM-dependent methyltransferase [Thermomonosporaceae]|uniref:class I SAM-dependent methyltransferase n=1 Tax=Thermomonosporaceae TaxID=2012 RepID=UPI00255B29E3|nr:MULTISPECIES: methyltransferase domain-containing protein [Thermomonosporaceae]MDL4777180.1 methyltransferase domain-containing protein [Actinomadura xylanilytica]
MANTLFARFFDLAAGRAEKRGQAALRRELLAGLTGRVVEVGAGNGLNFRHYPPQVREVVAVEPQPFLRGRAGTAAAREAGDVIRVTDGTAEHVPAADASADAVVVSGVLCSVSDPDAALAEFRRVLRPGGELRFYEHVRADGGYGRRQDLVDRVWPRLNGGCHCNRDTLATLERAGYRVESRRRLVFPATALLSVVAPRVIGRAVPC